MRHNTLRAVALAATVTAFPLASQGVAVAGFGQHRLASYHVTELGALGGAASAGNSINNRGWVTGNSDLPGDRMTRATLWRAGTTVSLGTLGGPNSAVLWPVKNDKGLIVGVSETAKLNPLGEDWSCSVFFPTVTHHVCRGFVWRDGSMRALPTLGGPDGFATGANDRGRVVGWAENTVHDPTCQAPQVLQFRAVVWNIRQHKMARRHKITELRPLSNDTVSAATAINNRGQVVGISGICGFAVGGFSARHAVLWQHGTVRNLGSLGGKAWNTPMAINNWGEVVGFANLPGRDQAAPNFHAFIWTRHGPMRDLGTLPGDAVSEGLGINDRGQVVGISCKAGFADCRAFLWDHGVMTDLSKLAPTYPGHLVFANDINDLGDITGQAIDPRSGHRVAFLATPRH
jgi:probable HAF family extracellular repeat protein